jgi:tRNA dimethylallyltransferase
MGARALHDRLADTDPAAAAAILPDNGRRIVRALEVVELRGSFTATLPGYRYVVPAEQIGLRPPRPVLDQRIEARVHRMFAEGLVGEVEGLLAMGLRQGVTASRALGYAQVIEALEGSLTLEQALDRTVVATRRFARRQESWFGRDPRITWIDATEPDDVATQAMSLVGA